MRLPSRPRLYANDESYGLRRELEEPRASSPPAWLRKLEPADVDVLAGGGPHLRRLAAAGAGRAYVATGKDGVPALAVWLFLPADAGATQALFGGLYPRLAPGEALLAELFVPPRARGLELAPAAIVEIGRQAAARGARTMLTFVPVHDVALCTACERAGFAPYVLRQVRWRLFRRSVTYAALSLMSTPMRELTARASGADPSRATDRAL